MSLCQQARSSDPAPSTPTPASALDDALVERRDRTMLKCAVVGQATGILMERLDLPAEPALAMISQVAAEEGRPAMDVATRLVQMRQLRERSNIRPAPVPEPVLDADPGPVADLSPREVEVLTMVALGSTNDEIATALYLSLNTVKTYIRTSYRKIGATRRAQAVIWGREHGLVGTGSPPPTAA